MRNNDEQTIAHFMVTRVRVSPEENERGHTPLAVARQSLHDAALEHDLNLSDILLRGDRSSAWGLRIVEDRATVSGILDKHMEHAKALAANPPETLVDIVRPGHRERINARRLERFGSVEAWEAHREQEMHKGRARRAAAIVAGYVEKYGPLT